MKFLQDRKSQKHIDIFEGHDIKQVNVNRIIIPFIPVGWHFHQDQEDVFYCLKGSFLVGLVRPKDDMKHILFRAEFHHVEWKVISDRNPEPFHIPPKCWHGYMALEPDSMIMFGMKNKFDPEDTDSVYPEFWGDWRVKE